MNSTIYPEQPLAAKWALGYPLLHRGPLKDHLAARGCTEFVVEFNSCIITGEESNVAYLPLTGSGPYITEYAVS